MIGDKKDASERLIIALDVNGYDEAAKTIDALSGVAKWFKVGSQLFTSAGPKIIEKIKSADIKVFLDLKFHDIPTTVSLAGQAAVDLGVDLFNVHAFGGEQMMKKLSKDIDDYCSKNSKPRPLIVAVTVLTSMDATSLSELGLEQEPRDMVSHLASIAKISGLDGVVASPEEASEIKSKIGSEFLVITPGIRPVWASKDDQRRVKTPLEAIKAGADYLVIGRPILKAQNPVEAIDKILEEVNFAL